MKTSDYVLLDSNILVYAADINPLIIKHQKI